MHKRELKFNIPMFAALVLLLLTMISMHLTCGLYARYTANSQGSASARVAKFQVEVSELTAVDDTQGHYTFTVTNNSEVTVKFALDVEIDSAISFTLKDTADSTAYDSTVKGGLLSYEDADWVLAPNGAERTFDVTFGIDDWTIITKDATAPTASNDFSYKIFVTAEQVD